MTVEHDGELNARLSELTAEGGTADLADLTDEYEWDIVHLFVEGTPANEISDKVGEPVIAGEYYDEPGKLMVFVKDDQPVAAVSVVPDPFITGGRYTWGADTRLEPANSSRPTLLRLVEP